MNTWRRGTAVSALLVLMASTAGAPAALGATSTSDAKAKQANLGNQISQLRDQATEASAEQADLLNRLSDLQQRKADLDAQTADLQTQLNDAQAKRDAAQVELDAKVAQEQQAQAALVAAQAALAASSQKMKEQAVDAYMGGQTDQNLANFVLQSEDMRQVSAASEYLSQIVDDRRAIVEQHRELEGQANDLATQITTAREQAQGARDTIAAQEAVLTSQKAQLDTLTQQAVDEAAAQQALNVEIEQKKSLISSQIQSLQAQSDAIGAQLRQADKSTTPAPPASHGQLANPVPGATRTSPFSMRVDPVTGVYQQHAGQDFGVPTGTPIHAAADGTVVTVQPTSQSGGYGNYTCISHGGGLATCYAHQSQFMVTVGQHVTRNQVIGLSGSTGYSTGPHLHFEVRINGKPVDPMPYL